jgi:uncharacterized protein (DUF1800 family)
MSDDLKSVDPSWAWSPFEPTAQRPWNRATAAHVYRRAGFAATHAELDEAVRQAPSELVKDLVAGKKADAAFDAEMDALFKQILARGGKDGLAAGWLLRMIRTPDQALEKLTLFWHGHFATSHAKVKKAATMYEQNALLRRHARGKFGELVSGIARDPAMLIYLDSKTNRKVRPNENFARELMELFCLGLGHYTERDIQEMARAFTGWEVDGGKFAFNARQHDDRPKTFLGQTGNFGGEDAVRIVLAQPAAPRFVAAKLVKYFLFDEPDPPAALIEPLAVELRETDFDVGRVTTRILSSQLCFSDHAMARKVRSPVEMAVGLVRALEGATNTYRLADDLARLGQGVFYPPSVKGWDGGRAWINSSTLVGRANLVRRIVDGREAALAGGKLADLANRCGANKPDDVVAWLFDLLVATDVPDEVRKSLVDVAEKSDADPNRRIANTIHAISVLPEFHLA